MKFFAAISAGALLQGASAAVLLPRQDSSNTATVDLSTQNGSPQHLAAGFIYGIPDDQGQIPDSFYEEMGYNYGRAGGAQMGAPNRGWIWNEYAGRFASTKSNYLTTRQFGGDFIILPHDIWGTDQANDSTVWPGDNGDWTNYDQYLDQLLGDLQSNNMLEGMVFDIWNEPEGYFFWRRSQQQWLDLYIRTHNRIRSDPNLNGLLITGPSLAGQPNTGDSWWTNWLQQIQGNNTIPDQYSWHIEGDTNNVDDDLQTNNATLTGMLQQYGLPERQVNINEYGTYGEQNSAGAAWWISRLERYDSIGLRGNWQSTCELHDLFANLLGKPGDQDSNYPCTGTGYYPNGEYQVYKYYNLNMTGTRAATTGTGDRLMDVYATIGDKVRILTGVRQQTGTWYITVNNLSAVGLPTSGTLNIFTWGFDDQGHYGEVDGPSNRGTYGHDYSGNSVTFPVYQTSQDEYTAWGFEFEVSS